MNKFIESRIGKIIISIIWALGITALFRHACTGPDCIVIKGPDPNKVKKNVYGNGDKCYKFDPYVVNCAKNKLKKH